MAINTKAIKRRIKSVTNTQKITKAMEMVSAAKMRKSVDATLNTRLYAMLARELLEKLSQLHGGGDTPLLNVRPVQKVLVVLITSNRGLCGSFNGNVLKRAHKLITEIEDFAAQTTEDGETLKPKGKIDIEVIGVGKKGVRFAKKNDLNLLAVFDELREKPDFEDILPITDLMINGYREGKFDKVFVVYTDYVSSIVQETKIRQLLPLKKQHIDAMIDELGTNEEEKSEIDHFHIDTAILEPRVDDIIDIVIPRLVEIQLYQAILESAASEHSARMVAMKSASDAASDMIDSLTLAFNKGRQAAITQEIAEIAGGAAALE